MDAETAETAGYLARNFTAAALAHQIEMFEAAKEDEDAAGIASLCEAIATVREAQRLQG